MKKNGVILLRIILIALGMVVLIGGVIRCKMKVRDQLQLQMQANLDDVATQNSLTFETELQDKQIILESLSSQITSPTKDNITKQINLLEPWTKLYHFKRIGFVFPDGKAYTTDGYQPDLSFRGFFQQSMKGKSYVTSIIKDTIRDDEKINVFSIPIYQDDTQKTIIGVLFATYQSDMFSKLMSVDTFDGRGYSYVIKKSGDIVAGLRKAGVSDTNYFNYIKSRNAANQKVINKICSEMQRNNKGHITFQDEEEQFIYYAPLSARFDGEQCYLLTVIPSTMLAERTLPIMTDINRMLFAIVVVFILFMLLYLHMERSQKRTLQQLAYVDPLTGEDNYASFQRKLVKEKELTGYIVSMDLSEFKIVNNTCGVKKGDETLLSVWKIIRDEMHGNDLAAHINADHFVLFLAEESKDVVADRLMRIEDKVAQLPDTLNIPRLDTYFGIYQTTSKVSGEIGISRANEAKHVVKGYHGKKYAFYDEMDFQKIIDERELEDRFEEAIKNREFEVWYQPKFSTVTPQIVGAEALIRWRKPDGTLIPPYRFIPLFEKNGMISKLDEYVFKTVCKQQKTWLNEGKKLIPISVNISRASLFYSNVVEKYKQLLDIYHVPARYVPLEITESATIDNAAIRELIDEFHNVGFPLLLDDFGSGYSSLATLNVMHFDTLKLDKSLIDYIGDRNGEKLIYYTIKLAKSLDMSITAEGVEHQHQVDFLQGLECNDIQGYFYSKPIPLPEFQQKLAY